MKKLKYVDFFSGCGGLSYGFYCNPFFEGLLATDIWNEAKVNHDLNHDNIPFEIVDFSINKNVTRLIKPLVGNCDVVMGGPPCQGFSTLGKREVECKKSSLVDSFLTAAIKIQPKIIIMENVKTIRSKKHPNGGTYPDHINDYLSQARYDYFSVVLKATDFGLGQTRQRFFLIAVHSKLNKTGLLANIQENINKQKKDKFSTLKSLIGSLPKVGPREGADRLKYKNRTIHNHKAMNHTDKLIKRLAHVPVDGGLLDVPVDLLTTHLKKMVNDGYGNGGHKKNIYGRMNWNKPSGTIVAGMDKITIGRFVHPEENRLLTPRECARIQGFPDDFVFKGSLVTQYYLIGNAVPIIFSQVVSNAIKQAWGENKK